MLYYYCICIVLNVLYCTVSAAPSARIKILIVMCVECQCCDRLVQRSALSEKALTLYSSLYTVCIHSWDFIYTPAWSSRVNTFDGCWSSCWSKYLHCWARVNRVWDIVSTIMTNFSVSDKEHEGESTVLQNCWTMQSNSITRYDFSRLCA